MHGHNQVSQRLFGDHEDTHKSCPNIRFVMITIQQRYETLRLRQAKIMPFEFVLIQIMLRTYPHVSLEYSIRNEYNMAAVRNLEIVSD